MSLRSTLLVCALSLIGLAAHAESTTDKTPGSGPSPYVDCGIRAALFPTVHWAAVSSNVIWDLGTTAVTSATASPQTCNGKKVAAAAFIRDSYERLAEKTAQGRGEHLSTVLGMFECRGAAQEAAATATRNTMADVVSQPGYSTLPRLDKAARFYGAVEAAAQHCAA